MTLSTSTIQASCRVEAPINFPVQPQKYSSQLKRNNLNKSKPRGNEFYHQENSSQNRGDTVNRRKPNKSRSQLQNIRSSFHKDNSQTLLPVSLHENATSSLRNKRLSDIGKYNVPNLKNHSNSAKIPSIESDRYSSIPLNSRLPYLRSSHRHMKFTQATSNDTRCCYSLESLNLSTNITHGGSILHKIDPIGNTRVPISLQKSNSSPSFKIDTHQYPWCAISLKEQSQFKNYTKSLLHNPEAQTLVKWQCVIQNVSN